MTIVMAENLVKHLANAILTQGSDFSTIAIKNGKMQQIKLKCGI